MKSLLQIFLVYLLASMTCVAYANIERLAPPNFELDDNGMAIFVNFISAEYDITLNVSNQTAHIVSHITFENTKSGMPLFDLIDEPSSLLIDGKASFQQLIDTPHSKGSTDFNQLRVVKTVLAPGSHQMVIEHELKAFAPRFFKDNVEASFFMDDFEQRGLLERYLPANLEYDQVKMTFNIQVLGGRKGI